MRVGISRRCVHARTPTTADRNYLASRCERDLHIQRSRLLRAFSERGRKPRGKERRVEGTGTEKSFIKGKGDEIYIYMQKRGKERGTGTGFRVRLL